MSECQSRLQYVFDSYFMSAHSNKDSGMSAERIHAHAMKESYGDLVKLLERMDLELAQHKEDKTRLMEHLRRKRMFKKVWDDFCSRCWGKYVQALSANDKKAHKSKLAKKCAYNGESTECISHVANGLHVTRESETGVHVGVYIAEVFTDK